MSTYFIRRLLMGIPLLLGISLIVFLIIHPAPGGMAIYAFDLCRRSSLF